jgi:hypothetical protein
MAHLVPLVLPPGLLLHLVSMVLSMVPLLVPLLVPPSALLLGDLITKAILALSHSCPRLCSLWQTAEVYQPPNSLDKATPRHPSRATLRRLCHQL